MEKLCASCLGFERRERRIKSQAGRLTVDKKLKEKRSSYRIRPPSKDELEPGTVWVSKHVTQNHAVQGGQLCVDGSRIRVATALETIITGDETIDEAVARWEGSVSREAIIDALQLSLKALLEKYPPRATASWLKKDANSIR